jgi:hypothetical protein
MMIDRQTSACAGETTMADSDFNSKWPMPNLTAAASGVTAASKTMRVFIEEMSQISQKNFEQTTKLMQELQGVRNMGDLLALQTKFVQETFENFNERLRRMSSLMAQMPAEMAQASKNAVQDAADAVSNKTGETPPH